MVKEPTLIAKSEGKGTQSTVRLENSPRTVIGQQQCHTSPMTKAIEVIEAKNKIGRLILSTKR